MTKARRLNFRRQPPCRTSFYSTSRWTKSLIGAPFDGGGEIESASPSRAPNRNPTGITARAKRETVRVTPSYPETIHSRNGTASTVTGRRRTHAGLWRRSRRADHPSLIDSPIQQRQHRKARQDQDRPPQCVRSPSPLLHLASSLSGFGTLVVIASGRGRCRAFASSQGAVSHVSISSAVVKITGIAFG